MKITGVLDEVRYFGVWISLIEMVQRQEEKKHVEDSDNRQLFNWFWYKRNRKIEQEVKESDVKGNGIWGLNSLSVWE